VVKYTTIKGTTIAGDVPCETDGWVRKADLRKLVEKWRKEHKDEYYYHAGLFADDLDELLDGGGE